MPGPAEASAWTATLRAMPGHLLRLAQQRHTALWKDVLGAEPTGPQYAVLCALEAEPGIDQRRLGALAGLDRSSTTDVVARLATRGRLARAVHPTDGRRDVLTLTAEGADLTRRLHPVVAAVQDRLLGPLTAADRDALLLDLGQVARARSGPTGLPACLRIPGHLLRRAQQVHTALFAADLGRGLTGPQFAAMLVLAGDTGLSQREVGDAAGLDRSTTADLVTRLERAGRVERTRDPADRRRRLLALTAAGHDEVSAALPRVLALQERLLAPLAADERAAFLGRLAPVAGISALRGPTG